MKELEELIEKTTEKAEKSVELLEKGLENTLNITTEALNKQQEEINYWKNLAQSQRVFCPRCFCHNCRLQLLQEENDQNERKT